jgi:sugar O-acyltransferase (sialic acid O-acetyltransferase NeuD family)
MKKIGIFGMSGFAREVGDIAYAMDLTPIYVTHDITEISTWNNPEDIILEREIERYHDMTYAIGVGENSRREKIAKKFLGTHQFSTLIHPTASFGKGQREYVERCQGVIICAGVRFTNSIRIGDFTVFNLNVTIGHDVVVDHFANLAPGAHISGNVSLGARCWVGTGTVINQGTKDEKLTVGADTVIGSGSVVVKHCDPNSVYVGIPAKKLR